jgi:hypothetical protein
MGLLNPAFRLMNLPPEISRLVLSAVDESTLASARSIFTLPKELVDRRLQATFFTETSSPALRRAFLLIGQRGWMHNLELANFLQDSCPGFLFSFSKCYQYFFSFFFISYRGKEFIG